MPPPLDTNGARTLQFLLRTHEKEYRCHVGFVLKIALELASEHNASIECLTHAALLHDIGRGQEQEGETHEQAGMRIARSFLGTLPMDDDRKRRIIRCIENHRGDMPSESIEEDILITADSASKIKYHDAFMLMCKKETFRDRAEWGLSYLQKGFQRITMPAVREAMRDEYERLSHIYKEVLEEDR